MSIFVKTTPAGIPRSEQSKQVSLVYAGVLAILALPQLLTFDEFLTYFPSLDLPFGEGFVYSLAAIIIVAEVFAIPFLLRMSLSPAFRWLSMTLGWFVPLFWLFISCWVLSYGPMVATIAYIGGVADLMPGWWAVFISLALGLMAAWSAWGLWPGPLKHTKK